MKAKKIAEKKDQENESKKDSRKKGDMLFTSVFSRVSPTKKLTPTKKKKLCTVDRLRSPYRTDQLRDSDASNSSWDSDLSTLSGLSAVSGASDFSRGAALDEDDAGEKSPDIPLDSLRLK